jgi:hypothetical protein
VKGGRSKYCTSCYTGVYPVAFPRDEAAYLQLALKLNGEAPAIEGQGEPEALQRVEREQPAPAAETDPVAP